MATSSPSFTDELPKEFTYEDACANRYRMPKRLAYGMLGISSKKNTNFIVYFLFSPRSCLIGRTFELLVSNGFLKLYTLPGRAYWVAQTQAVHITPDWKIHFSIAKQDISKAW